MHLQELSSSVRMICYRNNHLLLSFVECITLVGACGIENDQ